MNDLLFEIFWNLLFRSKYFLINCPPIHQDFLSKAASDRSGYAKIERPPFSLNFKSRSALAIFSAIFSAMLKAISRRIQIARLNYRRGITSSLNTRRKIVLEIAAAIAAKKGH